MNTLANNIKQLLKENNLTANQLSLELNWSVNHVWRITSGKIGDPRMSTLIRIAKFFEISMDELVGFKESK